MVITGFDAALAEVARAQQIINEQIELIGRELDAALLKDGSFEHLNIDQLEGCISSLPEGCFYAIDLKREWRRRSTLVSST